MSDVEMTTGAYLCAEDADVMVIITEWNEFRALDLDRVRECMKGSVLVDLRNIYDPADMTERGFKYVSIGR